MMIQIINSMRQFSKCHGQVDIKGISGKVEGESEGGN